MGDETFTHICLRNLGLLVVLGVCLCWLDFVVSDLYLEWLLAVAFVGGIAAPLNYRWVCLSFQNIRRPFYCMGIFSLGISDFIT